MFPADPPATVLACRQYAWLMLVVLSLPTPAETFCGSLDFLAGPIPRQTLNLENSVEVYSLGMFFNFSGGSGLLAVDMDSLSIFRLIIISQTTYTCVCLGALFVIVELMATAHTSDTVWMSRCTRVDRVLYHLRSGSLL